jgi:hypothetical protein
MLLYIKPKFMIITNLDLHTPADIVRQLALFLLICCFSQSNVKLFVGVAINKFKKLIYFFPIRTCTIVCLSMKYAVTNTL